MEQYPDPAKRRDRFLIQAAWADQTPAAELDVAERVTPTPPPLRPPALTVPLLLRSGGCCSSRRARRAKARPGLSSSSRVC